MIITLKDNAPNYIHKIIADAERQRETAYSQEHFDRKLIIRMQIELKFIEKIRSLMSFIQTWNDERIMIAQQKQLKSSQKIFVQIGQVNFTKLSNINLFQLELNNIEPLSWISSLNLTKIQIYQSHSSFSLKTLSKTNLKNLNKLQIVPQIVKEDQIEFSSNRMMMTSVSYLQHSELWRQKLSLLFKSNINGKSLKFKQQINNLIQLYEQKIQTPCYQLGINNIKVLSKIKSKFACQKMRKLSSSQFS